MKNCFLVILLLLSSVLRAEETKSTLENSFILRAGFSFNHIEMNTDRLIDNHESDDDDPEDETKTLGFGLVTSLAYRWEAWEFAVASDVLFGKIKDVTFIDNQNYIRGGGRFRFVSFSPQIKYHTPFSVLDKANIYVGFGPSWSLQTFVFSDATTSGSFNNKRRISFENYGGGIFIGLEEILPFKQDHPMFLEVGYNYMHSYKVSILDASDTAEVITLSEGNSNDFSGHYIIVRTGFTLF